jgi:hypothetical protein
MKLKIKERMCPDGSMFYSLVTDEGNYIESISEDELDVVLDNISVRDGLLMVFGKHLLEKALDPNLKSDFWGNMLRALMWS